MKISFPNPIITGSSPSRQGSVQGISMSRLAALSACFLPVVCCGIDGIPVDYEPIEDGHVDFSFCYEDGEWNMGLIHETGGDPNDPADGSIRASELAPMIVRDQLVPTGGRGNRLTPALWSFLGVSAAESYWTLPENSAPGVVFAGFSVCDIFDAGAYLESDPRVNSTEKWTTVSLRNIEYVGKKSGGGKFSMWSTDSFGTPTVWMKTADGVDASDTYFVTAGGHSHPNLSFSALGLYAVTFDLTFYEGPGKTNPNTSPMVTYYFAVGTYWEWITRHFDPTNWFLNSVVGEQADPDKDGVPNVVEYASDLDPTVSDFSSFNALYGKGIPQPSMSGQDFILKFPRRVAGSNSQIETQVETSESLAPLSWLPSTGVSTSGPLRTGWETITHTRGVTSLNRLFFRLRVDLLNEITY
jgi:hypothetical protein